MSGLGILMIAVVALAVGYFGYARWLEKTWGIDPNRPTPAVEKNDGKDFSPAPRWTVFAHQFTSITGAGPVTGPIIAAMFGWAPALLWMIVGGIFFGAVQDFASLYASVKNGGKSIGMIIESYVGRTGRQLFLLFCWLFTLLVIAAFCDMVANTFNGYAKDGSEIMPNAAAASISLLYMFVAVGFGLYLKYVRPSGGVQLVVGIVLMVAMVTAGIYMPVYADAETWRYVVFAYLFAASVMPMWLLKQPRDYLSMFLLIGMIIAGVIGVAVQNPSINMPAYAGFTIKNLDLFPILFVTIACGAVSGFQSHPSHCGCAPAARQALRGGPPPSPRPGRPAPVPAHADRSRSAFFLPHQADSRRRSAVSSAPSAAKPDADSVRDRSRRTPQPRTAPARCG